MLLRSTQSDQMGTSICDFTEIYYRHYPLEQCHRAPSTHFHSSRFLFEANYYLKHQLPAYIIDFLACATGRKPKYARRYLEITLFVCFVLFRFVRIYSKIRKMVDTLHYFTTRGWDFQTKAMLELWETTSPDDQKVLKLTESFCLMLTSLTFQIFDFDIRQLNWDEYLFDYMMGMRRYVLHEDIPKVLPAGTQKSDKVCHFIVMF